MKNIHKGVSADRPNSEQGRIHHAQNQQQSRTDHGLCQPIYPGKRLLPLCPGDRCRRGLRSTASVSYHLQALQEKGLLANPGAKGRKRALVTGVRPGQIPVVGMVTAGLPILAVENQEGTLPWHESGCFALRVRGDSMINAGILDGDKVVVRPQPSADNGQIVVARIEDEATVKRLLRKNGQVWLMPENENYDPIDGTYAEIIGIVRGVVREY